eukprot:m51a1_g3933 hypothetical protein (504) ;mRNA; f:236323-238149
MKAALAFAFVLCASHAALAFNPECMQKILALQSLSTRCSVELNSVAPDNMTAALLDPLCQGSSECNPQKILSNANDIVQSCDADQVQAMGSLIAMLVAIVELPCAKASTGKYCMANFATVGRALSDTTADVAPTLDRLCDSQCVATYKRMAGMASHIAVSHSGNSSGAFSQITSPYAVFPDLCEKDGSTYCLATFKEAAAKVKSGDIDAAADLVCSDCFRRLGTDVTALVINNVALPSYGAVCQKNTQGQLCLKSYADAIKTIDIKTPCNPKSLNAAECSAKITQLVNQIGCCAASALPFFLEDLAGVAPEQRSSIAKLFGDVCKSSSTGKVVISFTVDNLNWVKVKASWDSIKANVSVDIAVAIGVEASEVSVSVVGASGRRSSPSIVAEVSPRSTSYTAQDVSRFASSALKDVMAFSTLSSATFLQDPTKPSTVSGGSVSNGGTTPASAAGSTAESTTESAASVVPPTPHDSPSADIIPKSAAPAATLAAGVVASALALRL